MIVVLKSKTIIAVFIAIVMIISFFAFLLIKQNEPISDEDYLPAMTDGYIKWVEFNVPYGLLEKAYNLDIKSFGTPIKLNWIELLSYLAAKYGGNFKRYKAKDLDALVKRLKSGENIADITKDMKYYSYFHEAYTSILGEFIGEYQIQTKDKATGQIIWEKKYTLKAFSPIAKGYGFSHYDDFGDSRNFGYRRKHLGNDLMGNVGTPIIAVESGIVEVAAWNVYGGWRVGIRSFDKKRYYYYAHMRKDKPFQIDITEGSIVKAGDVIGYLGMTGYSTKENKNNIKTPHLHFGMQLIFDESQKEGVNQIWINVYNIVRLLQKNRSAVTKNTENSEFYRTYDILLPGISD